MGFFDELKREVGKQIENLDGQVGNAGKNIVQEGKRAFENITKQDTKAPEDLKEDSSFSRKIVERALNKASGSLLKISLKIFNMAVKTGAEQPKLFLIVCKNQIDELANKFKKESNGSKSTNIHLLQLNKLRSIFSNSYDSLEIGSEINDFLNNQTEKTINQIMNELHRCYSENHSTSNPQCLRVIEQLRNNNIEYEDLGENQIREIVMNIAHNEQEHFNKVYKGLKEVKIGNKTRGLEILKQVEDRPHYLVHSELVRLRAKTKNSSTEAIKYNLDNARFCYPGDIKLYSDEFSFNDPVREKVLLECRGLIDN